MPYTQPQLRQILSPETPERKVLVALEIFDPLSQALVSADLVVKAKGLGRPIVSWSGRFVWVDEGAAWPSEISITPVGLPFEKEVVAPPAPADLRNAKPEQRLVRIVLRPTAAADFSDVTAIRGQLAESSLAGALPVAGVAARLAWFDQAAGVWMVAAEQGGLTNKAGEFAAFLRLRPTVQQEPDLQSRLLKIRVQFTRGTSTRTTPENYPFLPNPNPAGRVIEGALLARDLKLGWADLQPV
jgi:hypothetical protein